MNTDFHYYATYLAARYAGFNKAEAETIGYAAAFVDEVAPGQRPAEAPERATFMTNLDIAKMAAALKWSKEDARKFFEVWQCFHFLPGNEHYRKRYEGVPSHSKTSGEKVYPWAFSESDDELFRTLCLPRSAMVWGMVNDTKGYRDNLSYYLHMVGIRMHVLADTWAHQNFIGQPRWFSNEVSDDVQVKKDGQWKKVTFRSAASSIISVDNLDNLTFARTTDSDKHYDSVYYLGHGRIGSIPDYGCLEYKYKPSWMPGGAIYERNNADVFCDAFHQMVHALEYIRKNEGSFNPEHTSQQYANDVKPVLKTWERDQTQEWKKLIKTKYGAGDIPADFSRDKWFNEFQKVCGGEYIKFIRAANDHVGFVTKNMYETTRFKHTYKGNNKSHSSSLMNYVNWSRQPRSVICMNGQLYMREATNNYPTGALQKVSEIEYTTPGGEKSAFAIDKFKGEFRILKQGTAAVAAKKIDYLTWNDNTGYTAEIIPAVHPI